MTVLVVSVGVVRVVVAQRLVAMAVGVGRARGRRPAISFVRMLVVRVVFVRVFVLQDFVRVPVFVPLAQVQPDANGHQRPGHQQRCGNGLAQAQNRHQCTEERCHAEVSPGACRTQVAQSDYKQAVPSYWLSAGVRH